MTGTPTKSGIHWIDALFDLCVRVLYWLADLLGISYNEINIWVFCVIWWIFTLALISIVIGQWMALRRLKGRLKAPATAEPHS